jgi:hypothetical protein
MSANQTNDTSSDPTGNPSDSTPRPRRREILASMALGLAGAPVGSGNLRLAKEEAKQLIAVWRKVRDAERDRCCEDRSERRASELREVAAARAAGLAVRSILGLHGMDEPPVVAIQDGAMFIVTGDARCQRNRPALRRSQGCLRSPVQIPSYDALRFGSGDRGDPVGDGGPALAGRGQGCLTAKNVGIFTIDRAARRIPGGSLPRRITTNDRGRTRWLGEPIPTAPRFDQRAGRIAKRKLYERPLISGESSSIL